MDWLKRLFQRSHPHIWETTHTNKWMIPTRKVCRLCKATAQIETYMVRHGFGDHWWVCSNGQVWPESGWGLLDKKVTRAKALKSAAKFTDKSIP